jgi:hypothetical protein
MEAILAEYGHGKKDEPDKSFEERSQIFDMTLYDFSDPNGARPGKYGPSNGGWTTERSLKGLARRVLHAIMTNDEFTVVLGGHSAAAGHGNLFKQSYTMQMHKVLEPVLGLLGVPLTSRNMAQGGLGTLHSSMGMRDIYGKDIDFIIWDR